MPLYSYRCPSCEARFDAVMPVRLRHEVRCASCEVAAEIVIKAPLAMRSDEFVPFESPATGKVLRSHKELREDLRASGCHLREAGEEKDTARRRQEIAAWEERALEKALHETATGLGL